MKSKKTLLLWILTAAWTYLMFSLSGQSAAESARLSGGLTEYILNLFASLNLPYAELEHILRKLAHFAMFGVEGMLVYLSMKSSRLIRPGMLSSVACVIIAVLNELCQLFFEGRSCELRDVVIDSAGSFLGIAFVSLCHYLMKSRRRA